MIKVTYGSNADRRNDIVDENITIRKFLEDHSVDYAGGTLFLDTATLRAGDLDKSFAEHGISESCFLLSVVKTNNA